MVRMHDLPVPHRYEGPYLSHHLYFPKRGGISSLCRFDTLSQPLSMRHIELHNPRPPLHGAVVRNSGKKLSTWSIAA